MLSLQEQEALKLELAAAKMQLLRAEDACDAAVRKASKLEQQLATLSQNSAKVLLAHS